MCNPYRFGVATIFIRFGSKICALSAYGQKVYSRFLYKAVGGYASIPIDALLPFKHNRVYNFPRRREDESRNVHENRP